MFSSSLGLNAPPAQVTFLGVPVANPLRVDRVMSDLCKYVGEDVGDGRVNHKAKRNVQTELYRKRVNEAPITNLLSGALFLLQL